MSSHLSDGNPTDLDSLLKAALDEYTKKTGIDLAEDHFANALRDCRSAEAVILEFERVQQNAHRKTTRESGKRSEVMEKLKPVVSVVFMLCETLGEGAGLVFGPSKAIFCGFKVLLQAAQDVSASYSALVKLFDSFAEFLERLKFYVEPPRNMPIPKIIVKTMAEMLSVVALATKHIKRGWLKNFLKTLLGNKLKEILDALEKLDRLTNEELRMVVAQIHKDAAGTRQDVQRILTEQEAKKREELQAKLWAWLSPPNVSANHDFARERHHPGTARWFLQGTIFEDWKRDGSLLWIRGKPGSGKTILR
ncbi:hypothetical protein BC834DRAFT_842472 [Gloeopeniophorella convolvens]|nr:hypothetical protein BC834DRAFT_842472 [Gloeopeniophorella convolvens]